MGFFSWVCPECDLSITYAQSVWQNTCILLPKKFYGSYDGYGRIFNKDDTYDVTAPTNKFVGFYEPFRFNRLQP